MLMRDHQSLLLCKLISLVRGPGTWRTVNGDKQTMSHKEPVGDTERKNNSPESVLSMRHLGPQE